MKSFPSVRLLPVLICVAILSLGIRVNGFVASLLDGEFSTASLSAEAHAAEEKEEKEEKSDDKDAKKDEEDKDKDKEEDAETKGEKGDEKAGKDGKGGKDTLEPRERKNPRSFTKSEIEILQALSERRKELDERSRAMDERDRLLMAAEDRVDRKIQELTVLKSEIEMLLNTQTEEREEQLMSLVKVYETMKPKDAARIFDTLDMNVLLDVLDRMKERSQAPILAAMNADRAREVTINLVKRRQFEDLGTPVDDFVNP